MATFSEKTPPSFDRKVDIYKKWKQKFTIWQSITEAAKYKQGGLLVLQLDDETREAVLELLTLEEIKAEDGANKILDELDIMFHVDPSVTAYEAYKEFVCYRRPEHISIKQYCNEFQRKLGKVQNSGTTLADSVLGYKLLKSANLSESEELLVKATTDKMSYDAVTKQLKRIFNETKVRVKGASVEYVQQDTFYSDTYRHYHPDTLRCDKSEDVCYRGLGVGCQTYNQFNRGKKYSDSINQRERNHIEKVLNKRQWKNPLDIYGNVCRCKECDSINHLAEDCPDLQSKELGVDTYLLDCQSSTVFEDGVDEEVASIYIPEPVAIHTRNCHLISKIEGYSSLANDPSQHCCVAEDDSEHGGASLVTVKDLVLTNSDDDTEIKDYTESRVEMAHRHKELPLDQHNKPEVVAEMEEMSRSKFDEYTTHSTDAQSASRRKDGDCHAEEASLDLISDISTDLVFSGNQIPAVKTVDPAMTPYMDSNKEHTSKGTLPPLPLSPSIAFYLSGEELVREDLSLSSFKVADKRSEKARKNQTIVGDRDYKNKKPRKRGMKRVGGFETKKLWRRKKRVRYRGSETKRSVKSEEQNKSRLLQTSAVWMRRKRKNKIMVVDGCYKNKKPRKRGKKRVRFRGF